MKTLIFQIKSLIGSILIIASFSANITGQNTDPDCENTCTETTEVTNNCTGNSTTTTETISIGCETSCPSGSNNSVTCTCADGSTSTITTTITYSFNDGNCCICQCDGLTRLDCCAGGGCCDVCGLGPICPSLSAEDCCVECGEEPDECCGDCGFSTTGCSSAPGSGTSSNKSVHLFISLGKIDLLSNAGYLKIDEKLPSKNLATPKCLRYKRKRGVRVKNDSLKNLRQIIAPQSFVDIVTINDFKYEIRFYNKDQKGKKSNNRLFQPVGEPYTVWTIENPLADTNNSNSLRITQSDSSSSNVNDFVYNNKENAWELVKGDGLWIDAASETKDIENKLRIVTHFIKNDKNEIASKTIETYKTFYWGEEKLVKKVTDPDGSALTEITEYYDDHKNIKNKANLREKKLVVHTDGSWEKYEYDQSSRKKLILSSWKDIDVINASIENSYLKEYDYEAVDPRDNSADPGFYNKPRTVIEKIEGKPISKKYYAYIINNEIFTEIEERCFTPSSDYGNPANQRKSITKYVRGILRNQTKKIIFPDGKIDTYTYSITEKQNIEEDEIQKKYIESITITHGTLEDYEGIPYKTTREISYLDEVGNKIKKEDYVYTGAGSYSLIATETKEYDNYNHLIKSVNANGSTKEEIWNNYLKTTNIDEQGITIVYTYDLLGRIKTEIKKGTETTDDFPAQDDITTTYTYDAEGRTLNTIISAGNISLTSITEYDLTGRIIKKIDNAGLITLYEYKNAGRTEIITYPVGATRITKKYIDGRIKSISGTANIHEYYEYGVNNNGTQWAKQYFGSDDNSSQRRLKTTTNALGRVIKTEKPGFTDIVVTQNFYDHKGQIVKSTSCCSANQLYEYNYLGELLRSGLDVDNNGKLELASMDRIIENEKYYSKENMDWFRITKAITYPIDSNDKAIVIQVQKEKLTGFNNGLISESEFTDINENTTTLKEYISRNNKRKRIETKYTDSEISNIQIFKNDLLVSNLTKENLLYKYKYDVLGRRTGIIDPRTGNNKFVYNTKGQISATIDAAGNKTEYFYNAESGRQIKIKDALGQISYTAYTPKGEIKRKWGAGDYPVQFKYDKFGNMVELNTYRGDNNYNEEQGPFDTFKPDNTIWNYDKKTGLLLSKVYADAKGPEYEYSNTGKLISRKWARKVNGEDLTTNYSYDPATGELLKTDYSDSTADITYKYNRIGQPLEIKDAFGTHSFIYNDKGQLTTESHNGVYHAEINLKHDDFGRNAGFSLDNDYNIEYAYDSYGRMNQVRNGKDVFTYHYLKNSNLIERLKMPNKLSAIKEYETHRNNIASVKNIYNDTIISIYAYSYDSLNRRTKVLMAGKAFKKEQLSLYAYNARSELMSARTIPISIAQRDKDADNSYQYQYDNIGNRQIAIEQGEITNYKSNKLNQYTQTTNPDIKYEYDADGNMIFDGKWRYSWNVENRLIQAENDSSLLQFTYDYMGRRFSKKVLEKKNQKWIPKETRYFIYDTWNLIKEDIIQSNNPKPETTNSKLYAWGLDLSQSLQSAGGVGGLLSVTDSSTTSYPYYDANGNITSYYNSANGLIYSCWYTPFGRPIEEQITSSKPCDYGFSTKPLDSETGLNYYIFRYYDAKLGRWMSKDPVGEEGFRVTFIKKQPKGFEASYVFVNNTPVVSIDYLGLDRDPACVESCARSEKLCYIACGTFCAKFISPPKIALCIAICGASCLGAYEGCLLLCDNPEIPPDPDPPTGSCTKGHKTYTKEYTSTSCTKSDGCPGKIAKYQWYKCVVTYIFPLTYYERTEWVETIKQEHCE